MNVSIGFRVTPNEVFYSVLKEEEETINLVICDKINAPKALDFPGKLKFIRTIFADIIIGHKITKAGIKTTEPTAQKVSVPRISFEAVIQELIADSGIEKYLAGSSVNLSAKLHILHRDFNKYTSGELDFERIENWQKLTKDKRESILAGIAALEL